MTTTLEIFNTADFDLSKIPPRCQRGVEGAARIEISQTPASCRREELSEIWWRGTQWAVTAYGLECLDGCYAIEKHRMLEDLTGDHPYPLPLHMAGKDWVDVDDFTTAWMVAIPVHGHRRKANARPIRQCFG